MPTLPEIASDRSGVKLDEAFKCDEINIYERLGKDTIVCLSTNFYNRVYNDPEIWFRDIFASSSKEGAIQNQYEFFIQRFGGPPLYSQRKGHPALIARHAPFTVTEPAAERWMQHMKAALEETPGIDEDSKQRLFNFFRHTAYFLVAGQELMQQRQQEQQQQQKQDS